MEYWRPCCSNSIIFAPCCSLELLKQPLRFMNHHCFSPCCSNSTSLTSLALYQHQKGRCSQQSLKSWGLLCFLLEAASLYSGNAHFIFLNCEKAESQGSFFSVWVAMPFSALQTYPSTAPKSFMRRRGDFSPKLHRLT